MSKIKQQFMKDFDETNNINLSFDTSKLELNIKTSKRNKTTVTRLIVASSIVIGVILTLLVPLLPFIKTKTDMNLYKRAYTLNEIALAENNSFKKINDFDYPDGTKPVKSVLTNSEIASYNSFVNATYQVLIDTSKANNMSYSTVGLYSILNELVAASTTTDLKDRLNILLGMDETSRVQFYNKVIKANSYASEHSSIQLKNAAFLSNQYEYSQEYVDVLTSLYCEAYQLDFDTQFHKMTEWVNAAMGSDFINDQFFASENDPLMYLLSTLYFKNAWNKKYLSNDNVGDFFYLSDGNVIKTKYMKHSYYLDYYYDYGEYISFKDYYYNSYANITYIIPKSERVNIYDLVRDVNIFEEKEENKIQLANQNPIFVNLQTPKFNQVSDVDFKGAISSLGFADIFNNEIDSFSNVFNETDQSFKGLYLEQIKQRNEVVFNEDGSTIKSLSIAGFGPTGIAPIPELDTLDVKLNQPFIYIIRDINDTPIFVGHMDNPID